MSWVWLSLRTTARLFQVPGTKPSNSGTPWGSASTLCRQVCPAFFLDLGVEGSSVSVGLLAFKWGARTYKSLPIMAVGSHSCRTCFEESFCDFLNSFANNLLLPKKICFEFDPWRIRCCYKHNLIPWFDLLIQPVYHTGSLKTAGKSLLGRVVVERVMRERNETLCVRGIIQSVEP